MKKIPFVCIWACIACGPAAAQTIYPRGIVNAASFTPAGLPGGNIARGALFSIFGKNLGPPSSPLLAFPLSVNLGGVSIKVSQGSASVDAIPVFVSPGQINAIMPSNAPLGLVSVRVSFNGSTGNPSPVRVVDSSFGIFAVNSAGLGPGVMQNFVAADNQPVNSTQIPAKPGDIITLYGTGLGAISGPDNVAPPVGDLPIPTEVSVGGRSASILYHGRSPCCSALDQIVFKVPDNAPLGCWVPVYVRTNNARISNVVTMAIAAENGSACADPLNPATQTFIKGGKLGGFVALRSSICEDLGTIASVDVTTEYAGLIASSETGGAFAFNPFVSQPPGETCTVYTAAGDLFNVEGGLPGTLSTGRLLSTGTSLSIAGASGTATADSIFKSPLNIAPFGISFSTDPSPVAPLVFNPGAFTLSTSGSAEVPVARAAFTIPAPITWTNRDQISSVDRTQPLTVTFDSAPAGQTVGIVGGAVDLPTNSSAVFQCMAPAGATSFTIPPAILSALPATRRLLSQTKAVLFVGTLPLNSSSLLTAQGLDAAWLLPVFISGRSVAFK